MEPFEKSSAVAVDNASDAVAPPAVLPSQSEVSTKPRTRRPRGFAAMDRRMVSEIASKGGKAAHRAGTAHEFSSDEAKEAGRKGGLAPHAKRTTSSSSEGKGEEVKTG